MCVLAFVAVSGSYVYCGPFLYTECPYLLNSYFGYSFGGFVAIPLAAKSGATLAAHLAAAEELQRRPRERGGAPKARRSPLTLSPCYYRRSTHTYGGDRRPHYTRIASAA